MHPVQRCTAIHRGLWCPPASLCPAAGLVSLTYLRQPLFGPPFMRQLQPARAFFIGDTSPQSDPVRFVSAVEQLCAWHWDQQQHRAGSTPVPLVVNTAGWVKVGRLHMPSVTSGWTCMRSSHGLLEQVQHCCCRRILALLSMTYLILDSASVLLRYRGTRLATHVVLVSTAGLGV